MATEELWTVKQEIDRVGSKKSFSFFHLSILLTATIILAAIIMQPVLTEKANINMAYQGSNNYDNITTGSINKTLRKIQKQPSFKKKYTIRHSVIQLSEEACIIPDGQVISNGC